jgi:cell division protein FtsI (penicillin-binding protein 3)
MQYEAEQALADAITQLGAKGATAVVMDVQTGDILAMANLVASDDGGAPVVPGGNGAVLNVFEPGSMNKIITVSAAIQEGVVTPQTTFDVPDSIPVADATYHDSETHEQERWSVAEIVKRSSNVGTIQIGQEVGRERLDKYLRAFGLGQKTALDLPNESPGILLDPKNWNGTSIASMSIGYGLAVTATQMVAALNTIATGGEYVPPRLVAATIDGDGHRHDVTPLDRTRVVDESTAEQVNAMLQEVVRSGTAEQAAIDGYTVAGKTGTARKAVAGGGYEDAEGAHYTSSFVGFVPAEAPRLSIIVSIDEPDPAKNFYAGQVAAPVFKELARFALRQYKIPPPVLPAGVAPASEAKAPVVPTTTVAATTTTVPAVTATTAASTAGSTAGSTARSTAASTTAPPRR